MVADVIGRKRFLYDLWGDAVNTASRMESHGTPGRIQITRATYELVADEFEFEPRGPIAVKEEVNAGLATPEVAGSSPVAPGKSLQIGMFRRRVMRGRPPACFHPARESAKSRS
jgi:Adenylate and Guanylate cyclase catalytic domain